MCALVVISPATTASPVVTRVSQATRPMGSCRITSSSTASEIWSAILSGWPSVTDSEVNRKFSNPSLKTNAPLGLAVNSFSHWAAIPVHSSIYVLLGNAHKRGDHTAGRLLTYHPKALRINALNPSALVGG